MPYPKEQDFHMFEECHISEHFPTNTLLVGLRWPVWRITSAFSQVLMQKYIRNRCSTKSLNASITPEVIFCAMVLPKVIA